MIIMYDEEMNVNRRWWDGATPVHYRSRSYNVDSFRRGGSSLLPLELGEMGAASGSCTFSAISAWTPCRGLGGALK